MSAETDAVRLAEIGARCERATEGPWTAQEFPCMDYYSVTGPDGLFAEEVVCHDRAEERIIVRRPDADFIAHAREDVPWLLKRLVEVLGRRDALLDACKFALGRFDEPHYHNIKGEQQVAQVIRDAIGGTDNTKPVPGTSGAKADVIAAATRFEDADRQFMELDRDDPWFGHYREIVIDERVKAMKDICEAVARLREGSGRAAEVPEEGGEE